MDSTNATREIDTSKDRASILEYMYPLGRAMVWWREDRELCSDLWWGPRFLLGLAATVGARTNLKSVLEGFFSENSADKKLSKILALLSRVISFLKWF